MSSGKTMHLNIITPDATVYTGEVSFIVARTELGDLGILPRHANLVAALEIAPLRIDTTDGKKHIWLILVVSWKLKIIPLLL